MQRLINEILERAKADRQRIVLPEGTEERTLKAANQILTDGIADLMHSCCVSCVRRKV